ncbi:conserved hypothetical protein [Ricinus communis]|uniref:Uncharacterized protein n=1 Tax=Ricinus communis TaxID=3988 RepID=B9RVE1_RICCO|nr:conserved hypothetical protein [Ricinus communis]
MIASQIAGTIHNTFRRGRGKICRGEVTRRGSETIQGRLLANGEGANTQQSTNTTY